MRRVVRRTSLHKHSNHARVDAYSRELGRIFSAWLAVVDTRGYSVGSLITQLDTAAVDAFPQAFANGRHQAYAQRRPSPVGQEVLTAKLLSNRHYLQNSLQPDIEARIAKWQMGDEGIDLSAALRQSFESRIRDQYGGALWGTVEAGYLVGIRQLKTDLAIRLRGPLLAEEDDELESASPGDDALAIALGLTIAGLLLLIATGRTRSGTSGQPRPPEGGAVLEPIAGSLDAAGIQVMVDYVAEDDDKTCDPCSDNAAGSPYMEDDCPLPGQDCSGLSSCRCELATTVSEGVPAGVGG